jgi:ketosteroid isomerase-like protein
LSGHARALFALALFACTSMHDTPESVTRALVDAIGRGDAAAATALFADDATVFFPVDAAPLRADGKAAIGEVFAKLLKPGNGVPPPPEDLRVQQRDDMAVVTFQMRNPHVTSRRTVVLERRGGRWLIVHLHGSNVRRD